MCREWIGHPDCCEYPISEGDEVYARLRDLRIGTFAQYIAIDRDDVAPKPASLTLHEAAAVPLVSLAAWQALVDRAHLKPTAEPMPTPEPTEGFGPVNPGWKLP